MLDFSSIKGTVLIVGGSGQIGKNLIGTLSDAKISSIGTYFRNDSNQLLQLDASNSDQVQQIVADLKPSVIINASNAEGGTDACELEPGLAERYHFGNGKNLTDAAAHSGAKLIQISTDYVFDGANGPYSESDSTAPISKLGEAKLKLERYMIQRLPDSLIIRTSFVYSWTPTSATKNFAMQVYESCRNHQVMQIPNDQVGNATYAPNFSTVLLEMVGQKLSGIYHVAGTTRCSKFDWAMKMAEAFDLNPRFLQGVSTNTLSQPGPRPLQSGFVLDKIKKERLNTRLLSLEEGLADMKLVMPKN